MLVVDDEAAVRRPLVAYLRARGCLVHEAADGTEALSRLLSTEYDVVVSDLSMPELGGWELWIQTRRLRPALAKRWLFVSAHPLPSVPDGPRPPHIAKPFEVEEVWNAVLAIAGRGEGSQPGSGA